MKTPKLLNVLVLASLSMAGAAVADEMSNGGYLTDSRGAIVKSGTGLCWHTSSWTSAKAVEGCDGVEHKTVAAVAAVPAYVAPVAAAVTKSIVFKPYTLQTEALFDFDKAVLRENGKQKIHDEVLNNVKESTKDQVVQVIGYADRIGSEKYNMALSQRRADAVKAYLVEQGVNGNNVETVARGEADPVVACDNVKGRATHKNKALVKCLQPNRRMVLILKGQTAVSE
jgi:OOP family OmpA-OmpF porin